MLETFGIEAIIQIVNSAAEVDLILAATGNQPNVIFIDELIISNQSATTGTQVTIKDGAAGASEFSQWLGPNACVPFPLSRPFRLTPGNKAVAQLSAATVTVNIHARGRRYGS